MFSLLASIPWWAYISGIVIVLPISAYLYATWTHTVFKKMGVPAPTPGFLGMLPLYAQKGVVGLDTEVIRTYGRVSGIFHGRIACMLLTDADMIKQIFVQDFSNFVNRYRFAPGANLLKKAVSNVEDGAWKSMRSIISPTFSSGKLRQMAPLLDTCLEKFIVNMNKNKDPHKAIKLDEICQSFTMDVIAATCFGLDVDCQNNPENSFLLNAKKTLNFSFSMNLIVLSMMFPIFTDICDALNIGWLPKDSVEYFNTVVHQAIEERRQESSTRKDFLQLMLNAHKELKDKNEKALTEQEILANSLVFIMAGYDTTSITIAFALHCLALHPDIQDRAVEEIETKLGKENPSYDNIRDLEYVDMILSETLRLYPPATRLTRRATSKTLINGYSIPKNMIIMVPLYPLHRDPEYWPDPDTFNPERFSSDNKASNNQYAYMPFGTGPRNCIGIRLANLVTKLALVTLLKNFSFIQTPETEVTPQLAKGGFVRPQNGIWLKVEKR